MRARDRLLSTSKLIMVILNCLAVYYAAAQSQDKNYIQSIEYREPVFTGYSPESWRDFQTADIEYVDGLGRPIQKIQRYITPGRADLVVPIEYDNFGRIPKEYLPFIQSANGNYIENATLYQLACYQNTPKVATTCYPWAERVYEKVPYENILEQGAPDNDWQIGGGHTVRNKLKFNVANEVENWGISTGGLPQKNATTPYYPAGSITINETTDEQGFITRTYTNSRGLKILDYHGKVGADELYTAYIYDDFGLLRFVMPPMAWKSRAQVSKSWVSLNCYEYKYDGLRRMVYKQTPGNLPVYYVLDPVDRPILEQDGNMRSAGRWKYIKYDRVGRIASQGICALNTLTPPTPTSPHSSPVAARITSSWFSSGYFSAYTNFYETRLVDGYTNSCFPPLYSSEILAINIYDSYDKVVGSATSVQNAHTAFADARPAGYENNIPWLSPRGNITSRTEAITYPSSFSGTVGISDNSPVTVHQYFYDNYLQNIQSTTSYSTSSKFTENILFDFAGQPLQHHQRLLFYNNNTFVDDRTILHTYTYDHQGREITHTIKNNNLVEQNVSTLEYNELGQLVDKKLHKFNSTTYLQSVDYRYNARGWLTSINNGLLTNDNNVTNNETNDLWGCELYYNTAVPSYTSSTTVQHNGNISGVRWKAKTPNNTSTKVYLYTYDNIQRLIGASYRTPGASANTNNYNENLSYDLNGNILTLKRRGHISMNGTTPVYNLIDNLSYKYSGNKIMAINDAVADFKIGNVSLDDFSDFGNENGTVSIPEYYYDNNGNILTDGNKGINTTYNLLNLPIRAIISKGPNISAKVEWTYDINGNKQSKLIYNTSGELVNQKDYFHGCEYSNGNFEAYYFPDGRIAKVGTTFRYEYNIKDHLGNARIWFSDLNNNGSIAVSTEILQHADYYPFGMQHAGLPQPQIGSSNNYRFTGKEWNNDLGLKLYDYGARWYDPIIGRWMGVDPKADLPHNLQLSTYCAMANNPITNIDLDGQDWVEGIDGGIRWDDNVTADNYMNEGVLAEGEIYRGTTYERERIWTNINVAGNIENGLMKETYQKTGKMIYQNLTPWVDKAFEELGVARIEGVESNKKIEEYLSHTQLTGAAINDATSWCAGFINWTLETSSDVKGTNSALALSFRGGWGQNLQNPAYGSIATISYGSGKGHVGLVVGVNPNGQILILGGNQGAVTPGGQNEVNISPNSPSKFQYHYPIGLTPYYTLPTLNIAGKSISYGNTR